MKFQAFNDGICKVYSIEKRNVNEELGTFNYREETVGITSFTEFQTLGIEVEKVISIPFNNLVNTGKVVKLNNDKYYQVSLIQVKDTLPKSLRLTLSKKPLRWNDD